MSGCIVPFLNLVRIFLRTVSTFLSWLLLPLKISLRARVQAHCDVSFAALLTKIATGKVINMGKAFDVYIVPGVRRWVISIMLCKTQKEPFDAAGC